MDALAPASDPVIGTNTDIASWGLVPFLISDRHSGRIVKANTLVAALTGYSMAELLSLTVFDLGLWVSIGERERRLEQDPMSAPRTVAGLKVAAGETLEVLHGWQPVQLEGTQAVSEVIIDLTFAADTRRNLERLSRFRGTLTEVLRESLESGLDDSFYERVLARAVDTIPGAQMASLLVRDSEGRYRYKAAIGCDLPLLQTISFSKEQMGLWPGERPQLFSGYSTNDNLPDATRQVINDSGPTEQIKVSIVSPVLLDGEPVAVFNLDNLERSDAFDDEALDMARDFAQHLAVLLQRFQFEDALWHQAHYDKLTGLPNRRLFDQELAAALERSAQEDTRVAICFIDLDNFKSVNDTYGHTFGDTVVRAVTERLAGVLPESGLLSRWGGDELVAIVPGIRNPVEADRVAASLVMAADQHYDFPGLVLQATISVGVAIYPDSGGSAEELLQNADIALYRAKQAGRNTYRVFDEQMRRSVQLQAEVRHAVSNKEFELHYQPRFNMAGRLTALEALARWQHPDRGLLMARDFIHTAEQAGVIQQLGSHLLDKAAAQARSWLDQGLQAPIAFNLSAVQLAAPGVVQQVEAILRRHALPPHLLELQVSESSAVLDVPDAAMKLLRLRQLGVQLLLDGIGSGFSSLAMLRRFQLDGIKISREFVMALPQGSEEGSAELASRDVVTALVGLGRDLGVQIIAEGVETAAQYEFVKQAGATQVQGYLFSRALPPAEATELLLRLDSGQ